MPYSYQYPHFALTVDALVFVKKEDVWEILLIQRKSPPFQDQWALPGGYVDIDETTEKAAYRELEEETGISGIKLNRLDVFDAIDRDPRERTVSVAYFGVTEDILQAKASDDAKNARWFPINELPELAFDHQEIIEKGLTEITERY